MMNTPAGWYERRDYPRGVLRLREPAVHPYFQSNIWFVPGRDCDLLVDSGMGLVPLTPELPLTDGKPLIAVATHVHVDHVGALHEFTLRAGPAVEAAHFRSMDDAATFAEEFRALDAPVSTPPYAGWDAKAYAIPPAPLSRLLNEGDLLDLGDCTFRVLHLPGHSPGCLGLIDTADGTFFSGDAIYDDELLDDLPGSDRAAYRATMTRLLTLDVSIVHGGHGESFGQARLREIAQAYLDATAP
ncbi:MAG: MBL fold metallo-hydrolase [Mesorhizobium sp.]|nr:MBL fold metallo-hydrolase [Mesorhizobium sp.]